MRSPHHAGSRRRAVAAATVAVAALAGAPTAGADQPSRTVEDLVRTSVPVIPCANGHDALATLSLHRIVTVFSDRDGTRLREVRHSRITGTLTNEDGSMSVPYGGVVHRVFDYTTGLGTVTGRSLYAELPGRDPATAGRYVFDPESDGFLVERGRTPTESEAEICAYLYPSG